jgi:hypothetical protein
MPTVVQFRRGTTVQNNNFLGANGEISVDTDLHVLRVADGATQGGFALVGQNCVQTIANKTYTGTSLSVTGNITGSFILGNGSQLTGIDATSIQSGTSNVRVISSGGNVTTGIGGTGNIVVVANTGQFVTGVNSVSGNITGGNVLTGGLISATGNITSAGNVQVGSTNSVRIGALTITDESISSSDHQLIIGSPGNIGNVIIGGNLTVQGNTTTFNSNVVTTNDLVYTLANNATNSSQANGGGIEVGPVGSPYLTFLYNSTSNVWVSSGGLSAVGIVTAASVVGGVITGSALSVTGTTTAASVVGGVITGSSVSVTGTTTAASVVGGVITGSSTSVTGTTTAASVVGGVITGSSVSVTGTINGTTLTGTALTVSTGNITGGNLLLSGAIEDSGQLDIRTTASNGNIVLTPNGTGNINTGANIMPTANATANIGSATLSFNTIFAKATSAQYADLAEMYCADAEYAPGTVLDFGGTEEVTATTQSHSTQIAGIVSTNPSYLMNSALDCVNAVEVALVGRVPCRVVGVIAKGDRLVASSTPGVATRLDMSQYQPGCIIGKALEAYDSETVGTIEVAVGRL